MYGSDGPMGDGSGGPGGGSGGPGGHWASVERRLRTTRGPLKGAPQERVL